MLKVTTTSREGIARIVMSALVSVQRLTAQTPRPNLRQRMTALRLLIWEIECPVWVDSGSSNFALERPLPLINLTVAWKHPAPPHQLILYPPLTGWHLLWLIRMTMPLDVSAGLVAGHLQPRVGFGPSFSHSRLDASGPMADLALRDDPISKWAHRLREKSGWQKAVVALANKNARILWAVFARGKPFDANHVSVRPASAGVAM